MNALPVIPAFNRGLLFNKPAWNKFAGESGAYVAESRCRQFEAIAEPIQGGWQFWFRSSRRRINTRTTGSSPCTANGAKPLNWQPMAAP